MPGIDHLAQCAHDVGFGLVIHGQVRRIPVSQYPQPLKIDFLPVYLFPGIIATGITERARIDPDAGFADLLLYLVLNGQSMTVPAGHVWAIKSIQAVRLDYDVFQDFIDGMSQVNVAIGVRRAVMQDILLPAGAVLPDAGINVLFLPAP